VVRIDIADNTGYGGVHDFAHIARFAHIA